MKNNQIANGVFYIGADDTTLDLFEGQYILPEGISYNSYVIKDEKIAVMDTIDARKTDEWLVNLNGVLGDRKPDFLIVSHMEPDHAANIENLANRYPDMKIVCSAKCVPMFTRFFDADFSARIMTVKEGETLSLGEHTLQFFMAPMVHWPEVMVEYEQKEKILFAADGFGKFGALNIESEEDDDEGWACEARRYYFNIVGKYGAMVQALLKKAATLDIQMICPLHGPILSENLSYYINLYDTWSSYRPEDKGIFIAYCSLHNNTEKAALRLKELIEAQSDVKVSISDIRRDDMAEAIEDAFRYDRMVVAAPTYDGGIMPIMETFISHLKSKNYQNRAVGIIDNGTWAPAAGKKMREQFESMKDIRIIEPMVSIESTIKPNTEAKLKELAAALIAL